MRIVYLNPIGQLGGAELSLLDMLAAVRVALPDVERHLIVASDGPLTKRAEKLGVIVHRLPMPAVLAGMGDSGITGKAKWKVMAHLVASGLTASGASYQYARKLRRLLRRIDPSIVHSNGIKTHLLMYMSGIRDVPVVWHVRDFLSTRALMGRALRLAGTRATIALAIAEAVGRDARKVLGSLPVELVYNAIDVDSFSPGPGDGRWIDRLAGLPPGEPTTIRVGLVATYARWKGHDLLIKAAAKIKARRPELSIRFLIVGGPIYQTRGSQFSTGELQSEIEKQGLTDSVGLVSFQDDPVHVYRSLDIVVHASTRPEPFGRTIVEAMACGRPVIVSQDGGAAELFTHDYDAVGVPPNDAESLAAAILGLADDGDRRTRIARAARATAAERFSRDRLGQNITDVYQRLLASPGNCSPASITKSATAAV